MTALQSSALPTSQPWQGKLQLVYDRTARGTDVATHYTQAPLKLQRPFYPEGPEVCHSVILHTAGGMVGGDRLNLDLQLRPHTHALITTTAAAKLYRSNGQTAQQTIDIEIAEHACLEWLPQETIAFNQAQYQQQMRIQLAEHAHWIGWEITRFGRSARGETFVEGNWRSHTEVWRGDRPLWIDRTWVPGNPEVFHSTHGLAGCPVVGSLAMVGSTVTPEMIQQARHCFQGNAQIGVTRLPMGLLCRYRGHSSAEARTWLMAVWTQLRSQVLGRMPVIPRVWGL